MVTITVWMLTSQKTRSWKVCWFLRCPCGCSYTLHLSTNHLQSYLTLLHGSPNISCRRCFTGQTETPLVLLSFPTKHHNSWSPCIAYYPPRIPFDGTFLLHIVIRLGTVTQDTFQILQYLSSAWRIAVPVYKCITFKVNKIIFFIQNCAVLKLVFQKHV